MRVRVASYEMGDNERSAPDGLEQREAAIFEAERSMSSLHVSEIADHKFWETQPVGQLKPELDKRGPEGPIDDPMTVADVRQEGYSLPDSFEWCSCDMNDAKTNEEVYELLDKNYVEDDDAMFRFCYSKEFLRWALQQRGTTWTGTSACASRARVSSWRSSAACPRAWWSTAGD